MPRRSARPWSPRRSARFCRIVGAVYLLGGGMAELDRLREQVAELRTELRASQS
jgi:hypothetical protein